MRNATPFRFAAAIARLGLAVALIPASLVAQALVPLENVAAITAGSSHTCALTNGGGVKCWGRNINGQLGNNSETDGVTPVDVVGLASGVAAAAAGYQHTCALTTGGGVKCWGSNFFYQLGVDPGNLFSTSYIGQQLTPVDVSGFTSDVAAIAAGFGHTCALTTVGGVRCWGYQRGDNHSYTLSFTPADVSGLTSGVAAIAAGFGHTCALTTVGGVKCRGDNSSGQLGDNSTTNRFMPLDVLGLTSGVAAIAAGGERTCALTTVGGVKCWGDNSSGQLGDNSITQRLTPVDVRGLTSGVAAIAAGGSHTCALTTGGGVKCWGGNSSGQLGDNSTTQRLTPVDVLGLTSGVAAITAGGGHTCALTTGGGVKCWGSNSDGQLGDGGGPWRTFPADVLAPGGGSTAKTLGSRATASPAATLFGGFELATASSVYILVRGNSLGTLGVTQNFLDSPRVRLFNGQGQDLLSDAGAAGFTGCSSTANSGAAVVNYYTNVRGQPAHARDGCTAQSLAAGVYTFTVTPSTTGNVSAPSSGEVLFEVTLGGGGGSITKTLGSRATVSPSATLFGGFELAAASTVYVLVRGNSLGTLGVTQSFLDSPRVRLFNGQGQDLITDAVVAGFTGCSSTANSGAAVVTYYTNVRAQPPHARDGCTAQSLPAGVYTFSVTPSTAGSISAPATGEVLFEVTLVP